MDTVHYATLDPVKEVLDILQKESIESIDTAKIYPNSEDSLGNAGAAERFSIDTKLPGAYSPNQQRKSPSSRQQRRVCKSSKQTR